MKNKRIKITLILIIMFLFILNINKINAVDELPDDNGKISSAVVTQAKTGTGPFDENDEPGNDSSEDNNIVRSFDEVTWTIESTMILKDENTTSYSGGRIYFEAKLPNVFTRETIKWNLDSMGWIENPRISSDGLTLTGYYQMETNNITVPGKQTLLFAVNVLGASNGAQLQPIIKLWLNGNNENDYITVIPENVTVSAVPNYNVKLAYNGQCSNRTTLNVDGEDVTGRIYGFSLTYQLYNENSSKLLKGIEYPKGDITLDLDMLFQKRESGATGLVDISDSVTPILWNYQVNDNSTNGSISGRKMYAGVSVYAYCDRFNTPYGVTKSTRDNSIFNSGNINMIQDGNKIKVKISDYKFDGIFPTYVAEHSSKISENIGCFSSVYFQILVPDFDEYNLNTDYYLNIKDVNFSSSSISGIEYNKQVKNDDDTTNVKYVKNKIGSYNHLNYINYRNNNTIGGSVHTSWNSGDGYAFRGSELFLQAGFGQETSNDEENYPKSINSLLKFDADCYEVVVLDDGSKFKPGANYNMKFNMYYVTKKDGTNWKSQDEMNKATFEDVSIYENLSDIPKGWECVGAWFESYEGIDDQRDIYLLLPVVVKDTAVINQTYGVTQKVQYYDYELDRSVYTALNKDVQWPTDTIYAPEKDYIKTEYDENGNQISGTHSGGAHSGNTILVVGAEQKIAIKTIDESGNNKVSYDLGKNENVVNYNIVPTISSSIEGTDISGVNLRITNTVPVGMSYVAGSSNYGDPEMVNNDDGTVNLIWNIYNCSVNKTITPINFKLSIYENSDNGTQYTNTAVIQEIINPDETPKIGNVITSKRTTTNTISVVNLSSYRLYNITNTPIIEKNGEIHYTVTYKNNTDKIISDFQMLDILPYNGDARGTEYTGDYTLDRIVVTQQNGNGETISNDNLEILYTNDEGVRSGVTAKDENLGVGWNSVNSEKLDQKAIAYVIKGEIEAKGNVTVDIYLKTNRNKGLDKYVNSVTAQVYKETEEMTTSNVVSEVVKRSIEGIAWDDSNKNGIKDEEEKVLNNVEMVLTDELGQQVTDVNGQIVTSVRTDDNGYYKFENLPKGNYYVKVTAPNEKFELTEETVGTNNEINSKFNKEENETDKITYLNSIDLPELTVSHLNAGFVKIEGSIDITKVDKKDNSKVIEGATFKLERIDDTGNVDSTFNAEEKTTNSEGKVEFTGLEVGKYKVTEIQAPEGYELLKDSIEVNITRENRDIKLLAQNELKLLLPETGGISINIIFYIIGLAIICISAILIIRYKNKILYKE